MPVLSLSTTAVKGKVELNLLYFLVEQITRLKPLKTIKKSLRFISISDAYRHRFRPSAHRFNSGKLNQCD